MVFKLTVPRQVYQRTEQRRVMTRKANVVLVARRAGLPPPVVQRAREVLANLERGEFDDAGRPRLARPGTGGAPAQLGLFEPGADPIRRGLRSLDPERMTPLEALVELERLRKVAEEEN